MAKKLKIIIPKHKGLSFVTENGKRIAIVCGCGQKHPIVDGKIIYK